MVHVDSFAVLVLWLVWQMVHGFVYCCCVRLVTGIWSVFGHYGFCVGCHSAQYDDWNWMADWTCSVCMCQHRHYIGMFHTHSMWMSDAADDDCSSQRCAWNVANGNVDDADCKLHWFWLVDDFQTIRFFCFQSFNFFCCFFLFVLFFFLFVFIARLFSFAAYAIFYMWHTIKPFLDNGFGFRFT